MITTDTKATLVTEYGEFTYFRLEDVAKLSFHVGSCIMQMADGVIAMCQILQDETGRKIKVDTYEVERIEK